MDKQNSWLSWAIELQNLAGEKTSREQILMCFDANESEHWETKFD